MWSISFDNVLLAIGLGLIMVEPATATGTMVKSKTLTSTSTTHKSHALIDHPTKFVTSTIALPTVTTFPATHPNGPWANCTIRDRDLIIGSRYVIEGQGWDVKKLGDAGKGLFDNLKPCNSPLPVAFWEWYWKGDDRSAKGYWKSTGSFAAKDEYDCVERAIRSAGGPDVKCVNWHWTGA